MEIIKAVVRESIQERKEKWMKDIDPSHKGYCTPMTKSTCTPRRKALAKRFKSGDLAKEQVGADVVAEVAPPGFGPDKKHAKIYNKVIAQYPGHPEKAYPTMWKIYNKMTEALQEMGLTSERGEGQMDEASYKVVSPTQAQVQKDDQARRVQTEPDVTENHKVQHRSAKTVNDLDNDPKNVRDPEVPQA